MRVISLGRLVAEGAYLEGDARKLTGAMEDPVEFQKNLLALERQFHGIYVFFAFHHGVDSATEEYVAGGSLGSDSGRNVLALFLTKDGARFPRKIRMSDLNLGVLIDSSAHPAVELLDLWFQGAKNSTLPGIVIFDRLSAPVNAVYVSLAGIASADVATRCRSIFNIIEKTFRFTGSITEVQLDFDAFVQGLHGAGIDYERTGETTLRGALDAVRFWIEKHRETIVGVIGTGLKVAQKIKTGT